MSSKLKLITGIVLLVIMIPALGIMYIKDNLHNNSSYCANCHQEYYVSWADPEVEYSLAHEHYQKGVSCQTCHQRTLQESLMEVVNYATGNYFYPFPETELSMDTCFSCHGSYEEIIPPTSPALTGALRNPHAGHWGELECSVCHNSHRDSEVYCDECHKEYMDENTPGWTEYTP